MIHSKSRQAQQLCRQPPVRWISNRESELATFASVSFLPKAGSTYPQSSKWRYTMQANSNPVEPPDLESFRIPEGKQVIVEEGVAQQVAISSIVSVVGHTFEFRENSNTPGRFL